MWKAVTVVLLGLVAAGFCTLTYGPCHDVTKVDLDTNKWPGIYYMNVMTYNLGASCLWVNRTLKYADGNCANHTKENVVISEIFRRIENGTHVEGLAEGKYLGKGHYQFSKELTPGDTIVFEAYWLHFHLPNLDCHYVCSDDERIKNGRGAFWCESAYPDALKENACKIKEIATKNNFDVNDLQVADNCNCPNIPFAYTSACEKVSIEDYFCGC